MIENLSEYDRIRDKCDHSNAATTFVAGLGINLEYPFEARGPGHGRVPLGGGLAKCK
jgi:hypothetical protein